MTPLRFYLARLFRDEGTLSRLSVSQSELLEVLTGSRVALIGNARSLANARYGSEIDSADMVIRINGAPMPSPDSHGTRTDWLALATRLNDADRTRIAPHRILWMSHKRKRLDWRSATSPGFYLHPLTDHAALADRISARPTTGAMMIDLLMRSGMSRLTLYGFDFFTSLSLSGSRTAEKVPHDFSAEAAWVADLRQRDSRLILTNSPNSPIG